jgi:hypothetical protein
MELVEWRCGDYKMEERQQEVIWKQFQLYAAYKWVCVGLTLKSQVVPQRSVNKVTEVTCSWASEYVSTH